jgi:hypothetical protein
VAGLNLSTGLSGSVVGGLYPGQTAAAPMRTAVPEGPAGGTVAAAAFGGADASVSNSGMHSCVIGALAIGLLLFMWWGLPR